MGLGSETYLGVTQGEVKLSSVGFSPLSSADYGRVSEGGLQGIGGTDLGLRISLFYSFNLGLCGTYTF